MREDILQRVRELKRVSIAKSILHVGIHYQLGEAEDLSAEVKGVAKPRLLSLLCGERLDGLEVEVVVEVQVIEVLPVDEEIEHIVALPAYLHYSEEDEAISGYVGVEISAIRGEGSQVHVRWKQQSMMTAFEASISSTHYWVFQRQLRPLPRMACS